MPMPTESFITGFTNEPLMICPERVDHFNALLNDLASSEHFALTQEKMADGSQEDYWADDWMKPYNVSPGGTLTIPVKGVLMNRYGFQLGRYATGYQYIEKAMERGMSDPNVRQIALDIDSPGGVVAGNFELVEKIAAMEDKPVFAFANDSAYSAAYNIAAAADKVYVSRSGGVGSIGVVAMHVSMEGMLKNAGIKVTYIFAGKHKVDGNMAQDLPKAVQDRFQGKIDRMYGEFVGLVAENRGIDEKAVRNTEALTYDGQDGVDAGLADAVLSIETALAEIEADIQEGPQMTTKSNAPVEANTGQITQEAMDAAVATATADATKAGATAERERIGAILASDEAKERPVAAHNVAMKTDMDVETAKAFLADMPSEKAAAPAPAPAASGVTPFNKAMDADGNPNVGAEAPADDDEDTPQARSASMLDSLARARGVNRKSA